MAGKWDSFSKLLIGARPWQYARWLVRDAEFVAALDIELKAQHLFADALLKVLLDEQFALVHLELQSYDDPDMGKRMLEYSVLAEHQYELPVWSFVICLRKQQAVRSPYIRRFINGQIVHLFHFQVIKLWQVSAQSILDLEWDGLLPLLPLTKGGKEPEIVQVMIDQLVKSGDRNLLALSELFGGLAFTGEAEKAWFKRRFTMFQDIMKDSWVYQEIVEESEEKGREKGREEGRNEERARSLQVQRQVIAEIVSHRFPELSALAAQQVARLADLNALQVLNVQISVAQDQEGVRKLLLEAV